MASYQLSVTQMWRDFSNEMSRTRIPLGVINGTTEALAAEITAATGIVTAIDANALCAQAGRQMSLLFQSDSPVPPADENAQRESALWVEYRGDTTQRVRSMRIPGPDRLLLAQTGTDEVDIVSNVTMAALVLVLEAQLLMVIPPSTTETITVTRARLVGRAL